MSKELKMPEAQKLADLLIRQAWVEVDCQEAYDEFVTSLGCNLYDPAAQPAPGGEDVVLSAARTAPAEQAEGTTSDKYRAELYDEVWQKARDMGYGNVTDALVALERLNQARAALHTDNERLREEVGRLKHERHFLRERFHVAIKILRQCRYVPQAGLRGVVTDFLARINKEDAARIATPEVKS